MCRPFEKSGEKFDAPILSEKRNGKRKCENPYLLAVWNRLQKDADYQELFDGKNAISDCSEVLEIGGVIDLNNDGNKEAVVGDNGWLNGVFDQSFWIVRKVGETYSIILVAKHLEYIERKQFTNGFLDLIVSFKVSLEEYDKSLLEFDGKSYKPKKCWNEVIAARNDDGQIYKLKKSRITPIKCDAFDNYLIK